MGLSIGIGVLADLLEHDPGGAEALREELATLDRVLTGKGLRPHREPEQLPELTQRVDGFPYRFIHHLRRAYACLLAGKPLRSGELTWPDEQLIDETNGKQHHLLYHSDAEGFYVPQDFPRVLVDDDVAGQMVGSSLRLLAELEKLAPTLGIGLTDGALADEQAEALAEADESDPLWIEKLVWLALFEAARQSVQHGTLIVFG